MSLITFARSFGALCLPALVSERQQRFSVPAEVSGGSALLILAARACGVPGNPPAVKDTDLSTWF